MKGLSFVQFARWNSSYYHYVSYRQRIRVVARPGPTRPTPTDPLRPTWSPRVARRAARVAPSRSESLDRLTPSDKSRAKRAPETPRDAIFDDFGSIFGSIFEVFRGYIARATRLAARRAEPLFLLACAVLRRVRRLCEKTENRQKSTKNRFDNALQTGRATKTRFVRSRARLGVEFGRLGALLNAPGRTFWRPGVPLVIPWALPGRAGDAPRRSRDAPKTPSGRSWTPRGVPRVSRQRF